MGSLLRDDRRERYALWRQGRVPNPRKVIANRQWSIRNLLLLTSLAAVASGYFGSQLSLRGFLPVMVMLGVVLGADRKSFDLRPLGHHACGGCIGGMAAALVGTLLVVYSQPAINESTIRTAAQILLRMGLAAILLGISYGLWLDHRWLNQMPTTQVRRRPDPARPVVTSARRTIDTTEGSVSLRVGLVVSLLAHIVFFSEIRGNFDPQSHWINETEVSDDLVISLRQLQPPAEERERITFMRIPPLNPSSASASLLPQKAVESTTKPTAKLPSMFHTDALPNDQSTLKESNLDSQYPASLFQPIESEEPFPPRSLEEYSKLDAMAKPGRRLPGRTAPATSSRAVPSSAVGERAIPTAVYRRTYCDGTYGISEFGGIRLAVRNWTFSGRSSSGIQFHGTGSGSTGTGKRRFTKKTVSGTSTCTFGGLTFKITATGWLELNKRRFDVVSGQTLIVINEHGKIEFVRAIGERLSNHP